MLNREQYLLTKLAEEACEIGQIALKSQQFGLNEIYQVDSNKERIHKELNDLLGIVEMLNQECDFNFYPDDEQIAAKINKTNRYYKYSINCGCVDGNNE